MDKISAKQEPVDVALVVIEETCNVLDCDRTSFFFVDGDYLDLVIAKGATNIRLPKNTGFAGKCGTEGIVLNIPDAYKDTSGLFNPEFDKKSGYRTTQILACPVKDPDGSIVGVLQAINKNTNQAFDKIDENLFIAIAKQVGVALRYAYQAEESQKATVQKNSLISYIKSMNTSTTATSVLFNLNKAASDLLGADRCTFYTVDQSTKTMSIISANSTVDITLPLGVGIAGTVGRDGKTINIVDAYKDSRFDPSWDKKTNYRTKCMIVMAVFPDANSMAFQNQVNSEEESKQQKSLQQTLSQKSLFQKNNIRIKNMPLRTKLLKSIKSTTKGRKPVAVVQLINKKEDMENGFFSKDDEDLLGVLLKFIAPIVSNSSLFKKKQKTTEASIMKDLNRSHEIHKSLRSMPSFNNIIEEGSEDEEEEDPF